MKKSFWSSVGMPAGAALAVLAAAAIFIFGDDDAPADSREVTLRSSRRIGVADRKQERKSRAERLQDRKARAEKVRERPAPVKPDFLADLEADKLMTAEMKKLFFDLQAALDIDNAKKVYALVHKLQLMDEWPDGIPRSLKMKALQALSWFGAAGMAEAVGFLADSDPEIRQTSLEQFNEMLSDWDIGDTGVSEIIKLIVQVVHDRDALDGFCMELNNMRPTIKADTALAIYDSKNPEAIAALEDNLDFVFGTADIEVANREDVEAYLEEALKNYEENPEQEAEDEEFYGPIKK